MGSFHGLFEVQGSTLSVLTILGHALSVDHPELWPVAQKSF